MFLHEQKMQLLSELTPILSFICVMVRHYISLYTIFLMKIFTLMFLLHIKY